MEAANILMVEDDESIRALVLSILGDLGHRVQSAETAEQGLALFDQGLFDVVLSDVNLPGIDGIEMVRRIRRSDPTVVPVIMTARRDQQTAVSALECGVRSFLMKPFSRDACQHLKMNELKLRKLLPGRIKLLVVIRSR